MAQPQPLLFLITGYRGSGKTSFCRKMVEAAREAGWKTAGLLSNPIFQDGVRTAIEAEDLLSGETRILATRTHSPDEGTPGVRQWKFDGAALDWGSGVLASATPCDLLVVDELGPLEFDRGEGWQAGLEAVDSRQYAIAFLVIRAELLGDALARWGEANLIEIDTPEDSAHKAKVLSEQLF